MDSASSVLYDAHVLVARAGAGSTDPSRPPVYKVVGLSLAIASGLLIGTSFVLKKIGLLKANEKYNEEAGEGYGYLKNAFWWGGMSLMILGEICNFVAYAFVDAILVTPLGALSVVVTTILSAIFLKERLSFVGKIGCFNCIIGSVVIVLNAPTQSAVADIQEMKHFVIAPGFLSYAGVIILASAFIALWVGPRYGKKSMLVYLSVCSLIGGLSVVATQGLGSAVVAQAGGKPQFNQWFLYVLLVFVVTTLVTEIIYLNKALNLFNAALVTPTYYVMFTSATIVTSAILFRGFKGTAISITTVIMGFLQICAGVVLLQLSKSAKDVPDAAVFKGDLDQVREVAEQEQPETEPKADAIRGAAAIVRRLSSARQAMEHREFQRLRTEKSQDLEPLQENEVVEWDGLRRRRTIIGSMPNSPVQRRRTIHPPLGMSSFPEENDNGDDENDEERRHSNAHSGVFDAIRDRASTLLHVPGHRHNNHGQQSPMHPVALTNITIQPTKIDTPGMPYETVDDDEPREHVLGLPAGLRKSSKDKKNLFSPRSKPLPPQPEPSPSGLSSIPGARRQFSFTNFIRHGNRTPVHDGMDDLPPPTRSGLASRGSSYSHEQKKALKNATEEERLGLVKGDSNLALFESSPERLPVYPVRSQFPHSKSSSSSSVDKYHDHPRGRAMSDSDDDEWQMTHPPDTSANTTATAAERTRQQADSSRPNYPPSSSGSRKRPSPPRTYMQDHPPLPTQYGDQQISVPPNQYVVGRKPIPGPPQGPSSVYPSESQTRVPEVEQTTVRQVMDHTGRSRTLSTSRYQSQLTNPLPKILDKEIEAEPESEYDPYDSRIDRSAYTGNTWGNDPSNSNNNSQDEELQQKFKEQSKKEREKRRQRMSIGGVAAPLASPKTEYPEQRY